MEFDNLVRSVGAEFKVIWTAPIPFVVALFVVALCVWRTMEWRYAGIIERLRDERDGLQRRARADLPIEAQIEAPATQLSPAPLAPAAMQKTSPKDPLQRIFLSEDKSAEFLMSFYGGHTDVQAHKLIEPYLGKWLERTLIVRNVYPRRDKHTVRAEEADEPLNLRSVWLNFADSEIGKVETLSISETIKIVGKIAAVSKFDVELECCEFAD